LRSAAASAYVCEFYFGLDQRHQVRFEQLQGAAAVGNGALLLHRHLSEGLRGRELGVEVFVMPSCPPPNSMQHERARKAAGPPPPLLLLTFGAFPASCPSMGSKMGSQPNAMPAATAFSGSGGVIIIIDIIIAGITIVVIIIGADIIIVIICISIIVITAMIVMIVIGLGKVIIAVIIIIVIIAAMMILIIIFIQKLLHKNKQAAPQAQSAFSPTCCAPRRDNFAATFPREELHRMAIAHAERERAHGSGTLSMRGEGGWKLFECRRALQGCHTLHETHERSPPACAFALQSPCHQIQRACY